MSRIALPLLALTVTFCLPLRAGPFPERTQKLGTGGEFTLRGVVNLVTLPVGDDFELGATQGAYLLFTPYPLTAEYVDEDGGKVKESGLVIFHLTGPDAVLAKFEKVAGKPVELVGSPIAAHTRHHRTPLVMDVKSIRVLNE